MKKYFYLLLLCIPAILAAQNTKLPVIISPKFKKDTVSIVTNGAIPDGYTLNTKSINNTIDALSKKGGGVVLVPSGLWLTGPVVIKSNIDSSFTVVSFFGRAKRVIN